MTFTNFSPILFVWSKETCAKFHIYTQAAQWMLEKNILPVRKGHIAKQMWFSNQTDRMQMTEKNINDKNMWSTRIII